MQFQLMNDPFTGEPSDRFIIFTDDDGNVWTVPKDSNWMWDLYQQWLAEGNEPLPA